MKTIKLVLLVVLSLALVLVVVQNTDPTQAHFLWLRAEVPVILLLFLTAVGGFISGLLVALMVKNGAKSKRKRGGAADSVSPGEGSAPSKHV